MKSPTMIATILNIEHSNIQAITIMYHCNGQNWQRARSEFMFTTPASKSLILNPGSRQTEIEQNILDGHGSYQGCMFDLSQYTIILQLLIEICFIKIKRFSFVTELFSEPIKGTNNCLGNKAARVKEKLQHQHIGLAWPGHRKKQWTELSFQFATMCPTSFELFW